MSKDKEAYDLWDIVGSIRHDVDRLGCIANNLLVGGTAAKDAKADEYAGFKRERSGGRIHCRVCDGQKRIVAFPEQPRWPRGYDPDGAMTVMRCPVCRKEERECPTCKGSGEVTAKSVVVGVQGQSDDRGDEGGGYGDGGAEDVCGHELK